MRLPLVNEKKIETWLRESPNFAMPVTCVPIIFGETFHIKFSLVITFQIYHINLYIYIYIYICVVPIQKSCSLLFQEGKLSDYFFLLCKKKIIFYDWISSFCEMQFSYVSPNFKICFFYSWYHFIIDFKSIDGNC